MLRASRGVMDNINDVVSHYEYTVADSGETFRNTDVATVRDGPIVATRAFFGGKER